MNIKMKFANLGPLDSGELELSNLTILCGENNSGKTYLTYALYGFLSSWRFVARTPLSTDELASLREDGKLSINLEDRFSHKWGRHAETWSRRYKDLLPQILGGREENFAKTEIHFSIPLVPTWNRYGYQREYLGKDQRLQIGISKDVASSVIDIAVPKKRTDAGLSSLTQPMVRFIEDALLDVLPGRMFPSDVFMASAERTGASIFREELNLAKNRLVDLLSKDNSSLSPNDLLNSVFKANYALPVRHNVEFVNQLGSLDVSTGNLIEKFPELRILFSSITGGTFKTTRDGVIQYIPKGSRTKLSLGEASSSVRSLMILWYWLNHQAEEGQLLMIDEPELNLHPENQRQLARFIGALVRSGVRVFITTHSDYLIRELNTLILLHSEKQHLRSVREKYGYTEKDSLNPNLVKLYTTGTTGKGKLKHNTLIPATITPDLGIEVQTFDQTIERMNQIQDAIRFGG